MEEVYCTLSYISSSFVRQCMVLIHRIDIVGQIKTLFLFFPLQFHSEKVKDTLVVEKKNTLKKPLI